MYQERVGRRPWRSMQTPTARGSARRRKPALAEHLLPLGRLPAEHDHVGLCAVGRRELPC